MSQEPELRRALLSRYHELQGAVASGNLYKDLQAHWPYYGANYGDALERFERDASIIELGTGHGSLLAWLRSEGFANVRGVDASESEVAFANAHLGDGVVVTGDAAEHLRQHPQAFDVVVAKATLEHIPLDRLLPLLRATARSLRPGGLLVVDVPNMDWIAAGHERYMDLTHEVGFTRESLETLLRLVFSTVEIRGSRLVLPTRSQRLLRPLTVRALRRMLYILGEGASEVLFESRALVAFARDPSGEA